jgi:hypothetical protein
MQAKDDLDVAPLLQAYLMNLPKNTAGRSVF